MRLELYLVETARIATEQAALLDEARQILISDKDLSRLEQNGVLHALQVLIENAIGKAKQLIKVTGDPVPVSAYDAFETLERLGRINQSSLEQWGLAIGLRNRIVHDYMNIDMNVVFQMIRNNQYQFLTDFLSSSEKF